jgi:hypothetical protein
MLGALLVRPDWAPPPEDYMRVSAAVGALMPMSVLGGYGRAVATA